MVQININLNAADISETFEGTVQAAIDALRADITALQSGQPPVDPPAGSPGKFDATHSPVAFWNFDGDLTEGSGNLDLTLDKELGAAAPEFLEMPDVAPGYQGLHVYPGQRYGIPLADSGPLKLQGNMTAQMIVRIDTAPTQNFFLLAFGGSTENPLENMHYELMFYTVNPGFPLQPGYFHEHASGVNDEATTVGAHTPANGTTYLLGFVRSGNTVQLYLDGQPLGDLITGITPLDGGENGRFVLGGLTQSNSPCHWMLAGVKVNDIALTAAEMLAEYDRTLGA